MLCGGGGIALANNHLFRAVLCKDPTFVLRSVFCIPAVLKFKHGPTVIYMCCVMG